MGEASSERLNIRLAVGRRGDARSGALGARLSKAIGGTRIGGGFSAGGNGHARSSGASSSRSFGSDHRQRVVIKVSFSPHRPGSGKLAAHAAYLGRDGAAREEEQGLRQAEISGFAHDLRDQGRGSFTASEHTVRDGWQIGQFEELYSGRVAVLERARGLAGQLVLAPAQLESALQIGDTVSLGGVGRGGIVQMVQDLDFGLGLGR